MLDYARILRRIAGNKRFTHPSVSPRTLRGAAAEIERLRGLATAIAEDLAGKDRAMRSYYDEANEAAARCNGLQHRLWAAEASLSQRWALAREVEQALGISTGMPSDEALRQGVEAIRQLIAERDAARAALESREAQLAALRVEDQPLYLAVLAERDEARALLCECRPWVARGLRDHPAPMPEDERLLARLDALSGKEGR